MLFRTLKRMIERGQTEGMGKKLDVFYAADKITENWYIIIALAAVLGGSIAYVIRLIRNKQLGKVRE